MKNGVRRPGGGAPGRRLNNERCCGASRIVQGDNSRGRIFDLKHLDYNQYLRRTARLCKMCGRPARGDVSCAMPRVVAMGARGMKLNDKSGYSEIISNNLGTAGIQPNR